MAEIRAVAKFIRVQPRKVRIIADEVRGSMAQRAVDVLRFHPSKGAFHLRKVIMSAIANAVENVGADPRTLKISRVQVDEGPRLKRITARSMGRANRIIKKMSHITVVVDEFDPATAEVAPAPTAKVKARRTLAGGKKKAAPAAPKAEETPVEAVEQAAEAPAQDQPSAEEESK
jgi:large subunit ribosomal protein L22